MQFLIFTFFLNLECIYKYIHKINPFDQNNIIVIKKI